MTRNSDDQVRLEALADFLPPLEAANFSAGQWQFPPKTEDGVSRLPFRDPSEIAQRFFEILHNHGWVAQFDWPAWVQTQEAESLFAEDGIALAQANAKQLEKVLTVCVRRDSLSYGDPLLADLESGLILRIVSRARQLAREAC